MGQFISAYSILLTILMSFCGIANAAYLQYLPEIPVHHTSKLALEVQESLPFLNLNTKGNQVIKFDLLLKKDEKQSPLVKLPFDITLTLKDLFIFLNVNGEELTFDPRGEKISIPLIQLSQLIDKPLAFKIDSQGAVIDAGDTFAKIFKLQPALKNLSLQPFLNEMFFHVFTLSGEELTKGAKFQRSLPADPSGSFPATINYEIVEITDRDISAKINGVIKPKTFKFNLGLGAGDENAKAVEMSLTGEMQGTISWMSGNAMLYSLNNNYRYVAELKLGEMHWTMQMTISHASSSTLQ